MGKALYRKYRPKTLDEVVGEPQVTDVLKKSLEAGKISHAYLFIGPRGCGKTSVARIFAHEINKFKYELEDEYVDIIEIDAASNTGVDNIRELREKATIAPSKGKYKIYIIDEVHMLSKSAFNALLKTLEEPPKHVIFIMATTDAYKIPVTITSRAQVYTFKLADEATMFAHLKKICEQEKISIEDDAIKIIVKRGGGSFRDSLSLLDQIATLSSDTITKDLVVNSLGLPESEVVAGILNDYLSNDFAKITASLKELLSANIKAETIAEELINQIITDPKPEYLPLLSKLPEVKNPFPEAKLLTTLLLQCTSRVAAGAGAGTESFSRHKTSEPESFLSTAPESRLRATSSRTLSDESVVKTTPREDAVENKDSVPAPATTPDNVEQFLEYIKAKNDAIYAQLLKSVLKITDGTLHIYPEKKIVKTIISRDNNKLILIEAGNGLKIEIHEVEESENIKQKDPLVSKISDIMGAVEEVTQNGGEIPF